MQVEPQVYVLHRGAATPGVIRSSLVAMRPFASRASIDLVSDAPWPVEVLGSLELLRSKREPAGWLRRRLSISVEIDPGDDDAFAALVHMAPYSIDVELWADVGDQLLVWGTDSGDGLSFTLDPEQLAVVARECGLPRDAFSADE